MKKRLYIGLDESNHGRDPEIIVAIFSQIESDSVKSRIKRKRSRKGQSGQENYFRMSEAQTIRFISHKKRDFRYCSVPREVLKRKNEREINLSPIIRVAPCLIRDYIEDLDSNVRLDVLIDGDVRRLEVEKLEGSLDRIMKSKKNQRHSIGGISYYPKSKNESFVYPKILIDSFAHYIFRQESFRRRMRLPEREVPYG